MKENVTEWIVGALATVADVVSGLAPPKGKDAPDDAEIMTWRKRVSFCLFVHVAAIILLAAGLYQLGAQLAHVELRGLESLLIEKQRLKCQAEGAGNHEALRNYEDGNNPVNADEGIDTVPSPTIYCRHRVGDFEVVCTDLTSYSDDPTAGHHKLVDANRGGTAQIDWVKARLAASTAPVLVIWNPSPVMGTEWTDPDTGLLKAIGEREGTVIIFSADIHHPFARGITLNDANVLEVNTGTLRQTSVDDITPVAGTTHGSDGTSTAVTSVFTKAGRDACNWTYAIVESDEANVYVSLRNALTNAVRFSCRIPIGEREPQDIVMDARFAAKTAPA